MFSMIVLIVTSYPYFSPEIFANSNIFMEMWEVSSDFCRATSFFTKLHVQSIDNTSSSVRIFSTPTVHFYKIKKKKRTRICIKIRRLLVEERRNSQQEERTNVSNKYASRVWRIYQPSVLRSRLSFCIAVNATGFSPLVGSFAAGKTKRPVVNRFRFLDSFSWNFLPTVCFPLVFLARNELCF